MIRCYSAIVAHKVADLGGQNVLAAYVAQVKSLDIVVHKENQTLLS